MSASSIPDWVDASMLNLFVQEAASQSAVLNDAGERLRLGQPDQLETALAAVRSLKSSAGLVMWQAAVELAGRLEVWLEAMRGGRTFSSPALDDFYQSLNLFSVLGTMTPQTLKDEIDGQSKALEAAVIKLETLLEADVADSAAPEAPSAPQVEKSRPPLSLDVSMLDLFRMEAKSHSSSLETGLANLDPESASSSEIEPLMRAAHSIKGAARIVGLDPVVDLAHNMEDVLVAAQGGKLTLTGDDVDLLLQGVDVFAASSECSPEEMAVWAGDQIPSIDVLVNSLKSVLTGTAAPAPTPAPAEPQVETVRPPLSLDVSMLDLFRMEAKSHSSSLETGLANLDPESASSSEIEPLMRAAHSIKGAARIVGLDPVVDLAHNMEDLLVAAQGGKLTLTGDDVDLLLQGVDVFAASAECASEEMAVWAGDQISSIDVLVSALKSVLTGTAAPAPTPAPAEPQVETVRPPLSLDVSMLDLFRMEAKSHSSSLETGLANLEPESATSSEIEPLMRAAHSIKGAARIVGLDPVVDLAHNMEDLLVAAQEQTLKLTPEGIDVLLSGVDVFKGTADTENDALPEWIAAQWDGIDELIVLLKNVRSGVSVKPIPAVKSEPAVPVEKKSPSPKPDKSKTSSSDGTVVVTAENLSRLMGLAGECLVQTGRLESFVQELGALKEGQRELIEMLEHISEKTENPEFDASPDLTALLEQAREQRSTFSGHTELFESFWLNWEQLVDRLYRESIAARMRPFKDGCLGFPRLVRDAARKLGKKIRLSIEGEETMVDRDILSRLDAPLNHILRNACDHGVESIEKRSASGKPDEGNIILRAGHWAGMLSIQIVDDGGGIDPDKIKAKILEKDLAPAELVQTLEQSDLYDYLFNPGFSTAGAVTEISGRGVGLDVVRNMLEEVSGTVRIESKLGEGSVFFLQLPLTLSVLKMLLVEIGSEAYAFPLSRAGRVVKVAQEDVIVEEGVRQIRIDEKLVPIVDAWDLLDLERPLETFDPISVIVFEGGDKLYGLIVDRFLGERRLMLRPLDPRLEKTEEISAASILEDGSPILIFDAVKLAHSTKRLLAKNGDEPKPSKLRVLVVDDSPTIRAVLCSTLDKQGLYVNTAIDGQDGLNALREGNYDLLLSDVDMPRMNGLEMVARVRAEADNSDIPIIMVTSRDTPEDREKGLAAGADRYLTKGELNDETLFEMIRAILPNRL